MFSKIRRSRSTSSPSSCLVRSAESVENNPWNELVDHLKKATVDVAASFLLALFIFMQAVIEGIEEIIGILHVCVEHTY
jgi:hypothetical protein